MNLTLQDVAWHDAMGRVIETLDREKLAWAKPGAKVMHPGPMNRGVEIDSDVADDLNVSLIQDQVEMGVAARMAVLASLSARWGDAR